MNSLTSRPLCRLNLRLYRNSFSQAKRLANLVPTSYSSLSSVLLKHHRILNATYSRSCLHTNRQADDQTKEQLLASTNSRLRRKFIQFKYLMIKSHRPFNWDEFSAFFSWLLLGHLLWILIGTTTFFSLVIAGLNTVFAQERLAEVIGKYLAKETGLKILFESAIVPRWRDGTISFKNVYVSRRPNNTKALTESENEESSDTVFRKASSKDSDVIIQKKQKYFSSLANSEPLDDKKTTIENNTDTQIDTGNYTQFDILVGNIDVKLSLVNWLNGKGIVSSASLKGVRGVVDRTHVKWDSTMDPKSFKNVHKWGDFELASFSIEDLLVTIHQPNDFPPFQFSVYSCELSQFRKHWLFYDFLSASHISGAYDGSPFSLFPKQKDIGIVNKQRESRLFFHDLNVQHLTRGAASSFSWIYRGDVDITIDIEFPPDSELTSISDITTSILQNIENMKREASKDAVMISQHTEEVLTQDLKLHFQVLLHNTRAYVPFFTNEISYGNNALLRPIVAYINSRKTTIPLYFSVEQAESEFEGSWTLYDSGLMDTISDQVYVAFSENLADQDKQKERLKKVGLWSIQMASSLLLLSFGTFSPV